MLDKSHKNAYNNISILELKGGEKVDNSQGWRKRKS